jgi:RNA-directed DNA polymerase
MKRIGHLYDKIVSMENLMLADEKARKGKTKTYGVMTHDKNREKNLAALHEALVSKTYRTSDYEVFTVFEPKERIIYRLPYYPDRIVHHAIMNILEPIWVKTFTYNTYSCVKGRGIEGCARRVSAIIKEFEGRPLYCLKIDIRKYYPGIRHSVLKAQVRKKIKDQDLLWLLDEIICSVAMDEVGHPLEGIVKEDEETHGLPIGNYLSQYLANLCLCYFMHYVNENMAEDVQKALGLTEKPKIECTEYADDIVFYADNKKVLHKVMEIAKAQIEDGLELKVKDNWQIFPVAENVQDKHGRALDYVGYKFYRQQKLMRKSIKKNFCRKVARLNRKAEHMDDKAYKQEIASWLGWAQHSNSQHLLRTIINYKYYESIL